MRGSSLVWLALAGLGPVGLAALAARAGAAPRARRRRSHPFSPSTRRLLSPPCRPAARRWSAWRSTSRARTEYSTVQWYCSIARYRLGRPNKPRPRPSRRPANRPACLCLLRLAARALSCGRLRPPLLRTAWAATLCPSIPCPTLCAPLYNRSALPTAYLTAGALETQPTSLHPPPTCLSLARPKRCRRGAVRPPTLASCPPIETAAPLPPPLLLPMNPHDRRPL